MNLFQFDVQSGPQLRSDWGDPGVYKGAREGFSSPAGLCFLIVQGICFRSLTPDEKKQGVKAWGGHLAISKNDFLPKIPWSSDTLCAGVVAPAVGCTVAYCDGSHGGEH